MEDKTHHFRQVSIGFAYEQNKKLFSFNKLWYMRLTSKTRVIEMGFMCFFLQFGSDYWWLQAYDKEDETTSGQDYFQPHAILSILYQ